MKVIRIAIVVTGVLSGPLYAETTPQSSGPPQSFSSTNDSAVVTASKLPKYSQLRDSARRLLRAQSAAKTPSAELEQTLLLIEAATEIVADPRYATSPTLQAIKGSINARLRRVKKETETSIRRQKRKPKSIPIEPRVLAQLNQAANANPANGAGNLGVADYGPQLIELIQRTISPQSWDVNGGASTIQYWRPGMAIVVRAPESVHRGLSPLLKQLRQ